MDLVLNLGALMLLLLTGAFFIYEFVDFLRAGPKPSRPWIYGRSSLRHTSALLDQSLTAARQTTAETLRSKSRWRPS